MTEEQSVYVVCDAGEPHIRHIHYSLEPPRVIKTELQTSLIVNTIDYGPSLFIGEDIEHLAIQSTLADEALYHRPFVHGAAALCRRAPESALIIGGGEGCMAREVLKYSTIGIVDQIDWDKALIDYFKEPTVAAVWNGGAYEDPRLCVHYEDAFRSCVWSGRSYDLILVDLCDPDAGTIGPLKELITGLMGSLNAGGVFLMNAGALLPAACSKYVPYSAELLEYIRGLAAGELAHYRPFSFKTYVPSYMAPWCLVGLAEGYTIGNWYGAFFSEDELRDVLRYGPSYDARFDAVNKEFMRAPQSLDVPRELHWGC
jgi:predicted membrane-bound spermidine synthase